MSGSLATSPRPQPGTPPRWSGPGAASRPCNSAPPPDARDVRGPGRCSPTGRGPFPFVPARAPPRKEPVHHDRPARPGQPGRDQCLPRSAACHHAGHAAGRAHPVLRAQGRSAVAGCRRPGYRRGAPGGLRCLALRRAAGPPAGPGGGDRVKRTTFSGQQLAQVDNPDPFAPPVWRSPIYHTPGWVITIVLLVRVIAAVVRFLARHPLRDLVLAVYLLAWSPAGWPRPSALTSTAYS